MTILDVADYTGTGAAATLASILGIPSTAANQSAKWFQITVVTQTTSTPTRIGGLNISTSRGIPVLGGQFAPPIAEQTSLYQLDRIYLLVQLTDVVSVAYGL